MAPSSFNNGRARTQRHYQTWIIEDSWEGVVHLEARLVKTWQGLCGSHRLLEDREGRWYWWAVFPSLEGENALQKVVTFADWDSLAAELGLPQTEGACLETGLNYYH